MKILFDADFYRKYKRVDIRIQRRVDESMRLFRQNPMDPQLNNHPLHVPYEGYRSIDITANYRALYKERDIAEESIAYFEILGTHDELYGKFSETN